MSAQLKPSYKEVKEKFGQVRQISREVAFEQLSPVLKNRLGQAILRGSIGLDGFTFDAQRKLKS